MLRTSRPGVFAAGNVLHGAEQADVAALSGRHAAAAVARYLADGDWPAQRVRILCETPLGWIAPKRRERRGRAPRADASLLRARAFVRAPRIEIVQDERVLWSGRVRAGDARPLGAAAVRAGRARSTRRRAGRLRAAPPG